MGFAEPKFSESVLTNMRGILFFIFCFLCLSFSQAQEKRQVFTTTLKPYHITYNGSDNPNECWESVAYGLIIKNQYFGLPCQVLENLKSKVGDKEIKVEVVYYNEPFDQSGEDGSVLKVMLGKEVLYEQ